MTNNPFPGNPGGAFIGYGHGGYGLGIDQVTSRIFLTQIGIGGVYSTLTVTDTNYHHVAVTKMLDRVILYVDGIGDPPIIYNPSFTFTTNIAIGARGDDDLKNAFFGSVDEMTIFDRALTAGEIASIAGACNPTPTPTPTPNTPPGSTVIVQTGNGSVTFPTVTQSGTTMFTAISPGAAGTPPSGYTICPTCPAYNITTTATYTPPVMVCLEVPASISPQIFSTLALMHGEGGVLVDRTTGRFTDINGKRTVCGSVSSLSPFALAQAPSATPATVDGKVLTSDGRGLRNATVSITNSQGVVRTATTSSFGFFSFDNVVTGDTYTLRISSRLYRYSPQTVQVNGNLTLPNFVGLE